MQKLSSWLNKRLKYITAVVLITIPLYPKFPFISIPGTYVSIRLEDFILLFAALVVLLIMLPKLASYFKDNLIRAMLLYLIVGVVSLASGIFLTKTVTPSLGFLNWLRRVEYFVPFFLGYFALRENKKDLEFYLKLIIIVVFVAFLYGYGQKHFSLPVIITQNQEYSKGIALRWIPGSHINSTFAGHYDLASFMVLVLPTLIAAFYLLKGKFTKIILAATVLAGLWLLVNSLSRISLVSYLLSASLALILIKKYKAIVPVVVISLLFIFTATNILLRYDRIIEVVKRDLKINYRFELVKNAHAQTVSETLPIRKNSEEIATPTPVPVFEDRSTSIRLNVEWPRAIRALAKNPLLGTGYSSITLATDNDFLRALGETGLLGIFAFILIFLRLFKIFLNSYPFHKNLKGVELVFYAGMVAAIPGVFLNAVFIDIFEASKFAIIFWLFMGFVVSISTNE